MAVVCFSFLFVLMEDLDERIESFRGISKRVVKVAPQDPLRQS
ncbi:unnamed protein product [Acidithrix sp. C25]|nr:unnamed protein product [Acidithrix sp. C25]